MLIKPVSCGSDIPPRLLCAARRDCTSGRGFSQRAFLTAIGNLLRGVSVLFLLLAAVINVSAQVPEDFGYNRIEARGSRPLLVILTEFATYPAMRANAVSYYYNLAFNTFAPASNPSLKAYYLENSNGRFFWYAAGTGVVGPYQFKADEVGQDKDGKMSRITLALQAASKDGFDFAQFDDNGDGTVSTNELGILIIDNAAAAGAAIGGANRASDPVCFKPDGKQINLCLRAALAGQEASLMTMAHELLHSLGISPRGDIYGSNDNSQGYSTMEATMYPEVDDRRTHHLDPFHKMELGWVEPKMYPISVPRNEVLGAANLIQDDQPIILYTPYDLHEYFMLEYRTTAAPGGAGYDRDLPSNGLLIWHVKVDDNKEPVLLPSLTHPTNMDPADFMLGAPNMARGHGTAWAPDQLIPYPLRWLNTNDTGMKIKVGRTRDNGAKLDVAWGSFPSAPLPVKMKIVYYSDASYLGAVGQFDDKGDHYTLTTFNPSYVTWTNVVSDPGGIFYYNRWTGIAMLGSVDGAGNHSVLKNFPQGYFGAGWTHIVSHRGYLFFYNSSNGAAAIGTISASGFRQYKGYPAYSFGLGWTHIVSTQNGLLFYSAVSGSGAVGTWDFSYMSCNGFCFPTISEVRFKQLTGYSAGSFTTGWTSIVDTTNGVLFYRKSDGLQVMVDIDNLGRVSTRSHTVKYHKPGYTSIVAAGEDILLYNATTGDGALATITKYSPYVVARVGSPGTELEFAL